MSADENIICLLIWFPVVLTQDMRGHGKYALKDMVKAQNIGVGAISQRGEGVITLVFSGSISGTNCMCFCPSTYKGRSIAAFTEL